MSNTTKTRMNATLRANLLHALCRLAEKKFLAEWEPRARKFVVATHKEVYAADMKLLKTLEAKGWIKKAEYVHLNITSAYFGIQFPEGQGLLFPPNTGASLIDLSDERKAEAVALSTEYKDYKSQSREAIRATLLQFTTVEEMIEKWPEIANTAKPYLQGVKATVPAIPLATVNKMLGLPEKEGNQ